MALFRPRKCMGRNGVMVQSLLNIGARCGGKDQLHGLASLPPEKKAPVND
jgi:hypothetical protein